MFTACGESLTREVTSISSAVISDGAIQVSYAGGACNAELESTTRFEDGLLFLKLYETSTGDCPAASFGSTYSIALPPTIDLADLRNVMVSRCANRDCTETKYVEAVLEIN